jgi:tRNA modification GTPase
VSAEPGTTRDYVEVRAVWNGVAVTLVDTAGERDAAAEVERRGIDLGRARAASADLRLRVIGPGDEVPAKDESGHELRLASKMDLQWVPPPGLLMTSAVTGEGIERVRAAIIEAVGLADDAEAGSAVLLTERQRAAAAQARTSFSAARAGLAAEAPLEVIALEVRSGANALAALEGDQVGEEVLDALFRRFCIGK